MKRRERLLERFGEEIYRFLRTQSAGGFMLLGASLLAMAARNSPVAPLYDTLLTIEGEVRIGTLGIQKPLFLWINEGLMAVFFFLIGLEIKREILHGHLSDARHIVFPAAGALGGVIVPALIYLAFNTHDPASAHGWAVPTATDVAFALGVLSLVRPRVPVSLRVFLMTLAILDDLFAIIIIALFYTSKLSADALLIACVLIVILVGFNRLKVVHVQAYVLVGAALWVCVLNSGIHATLAGVVTAMCIPAESASPRVEAPLDLLIETLHPWVAFAILPIFAFANAGIDLSGLHLTEFFSAIPLGIALGLLIGKPAGVLLFSFLVTQVGLGCLPKGVRWGQMVGVGFLCGIGFTMSLFIGALAFAEGGAGYGRIDRLGVLCGSLMSGAVGLSILWVTVRPGRLSWIPSGLWRQRATPAYASEKNRRQAAMAAR